MYFFCFHKHTGKHNVKSNPDYFVSVYDFGAHGDGVTDDTAAFQNALNHFATTSTGGGGIVVAPAGNFLIAGQLTIPNDVSLQGLYKYAPSHDIGMNSNDLPNTGTVLLSTANQGNDSATPFITIQENAAISGLTIYYPNQVCSTGKPVPFPWAISMIADNGAVEDVELLNPWNGISAVGAHRHLIRNVHGQPMNIGLFVDQTYDIGRFVDRMIVSVKLLIYCGHF